VSKFCLQKELILVGFWLSQVGWIGILCLGSNIGEKVKSWFLSNLGVEFSKCIQNEVSKVWLQKKLILVGFWLSQVLSLGLVFVPWKQNW